MKYSYIFLLGLLCVVVTSCRTTIKLAEKKEIPLLTENKLFKNIETGELDYNTLFVKRMDVSLEHKGGSNGFKASMKIQRDSFIQISVTAPLGIEVARVLLTLDSIKFADVYHKKYFMADYEFFNEKYDVRLGYNCIQDILTNTSFNFESCSGLEKSKRYKLTRTVEGYELSSLEERALSRKIRKLYKKKRKNKDFVLILQKILIDPQFFRPVRVSIEDVDEDMEVAVEYSHFKDFSGKILPEKIEFRLNADQENTNVKVQFQKVEFDVPVESNFKISSKYKLIQ